MAGGGDTRRVGPLLWSYALFVYAFLYLPILVIFVLSFNDNRLLGLPFTGFTTQWYAEVFANPALRQAILNSLTVGLMTAVIAPALALGLALAMRLGLPGPGVVLNLVILPLVVPAIVSGIVLFIFFALLEIRPGLLRTALPAHVLWALPFAYLNIQPRLNNFDRSFEEAAADLGATPWQTFRLVLFPLIRPGVIAAALFSFSLSFDEFIRTLFLSGPDRTLPIQFWFMILESVSPELPALAVVIIAIPMLASLAGFLVNQRGPDRRGGGGRGGDR